MRKRRLSLFVWGLACIAAAAMSNHFLGPAPDVSTPEGRGEALGRGFAQLCFVIAGVVLIVLHFVRSKRPGIRRDEDL